MSEISEVDVAFQTSTRLMSEISGVDVAFQTPTRLMSEILLSPHSGARHFRPTSGPDRASTRPSLEASVFCSFGDHGRTQSPAREGNPGRGLTSGFSAGHSKVRQLANLASASHVGGYVDFEVRQSANLARFAIWRTSKST